MALPMDEQRILDEMERMLAADDPRLAARLASFGQPGLGQALRTRRGRITLALMLLALVAAVVMVLYMMSAFQLSGGPGAPARQHGTQSSHAGRADGILGDVGVGLGRVRQGARTDSLACAATWAPAACATLPLVTAGRR